MEQRDRARKTTRRRRSRDDPSQPSRPAPPGEADEDRPAGAGQPEPSEDFARRDIETADEDPEEHDRRRHNRGRGDVESTRPV
jgi:hypothetical protein